MFFVLMVPTAVMLLVPKIARYGSLCMGASYIFFGISLLRVDHNVTFGIGMFVLAAIAAGRFATDEVRWRRNNTGAR